MQLLRWTEMVNELVYLSQSLFMRLMELELESMNGETVHCL